MSKTHDVAADPHADDRLNDLGVELHESPGHALASFEGEGFAIVAVADESADTGRLHEAMAATFQQVTLSLDLRSQRRDRQ